MINRQRAASSIYQGAILTAALVLVATSVTDGVLHVIEFVSMDGRPSVESVTAVGLQVLAPVVAAAALLLLLGRDWRAAARAERAAAAADERAAVALRRLDEAIESIDQGFALFDPDDRLVHCNSRFREMYPRSAPFLPGTSFEELIRRSASRGHYAECDPRNPDSWIAERLSVHRRAAGPIEQRLTDGRWLRVDERRTADGGNVGLRTDITELKRRQFDLAAKTAVLEATLAAMVQGVLVWDADRRLTTFNQKVQLLLELPLGVLRPGLSMEAFLAYLIERGEFRAADADFSYRALLAEHINPQGSCCERRRPNGRTIEVRSIPVAGGLTLTTYIDVTESRAAEAQLRESEERFRKLSDSAMEGILAHENGVIVDANRAAGELLMLPEEAMIGRHLNDFIAPEHHEAVLARVSRREESRIELRCVRADGQSIVIEAQNRYVQHRGRAVSMVSFRNVTEQRQAEDKLRAAKEAAERASRLKNDFVRTISHELRTPMNGVLGMLELLQDAELAVPLRAYAATAYASAEAMLGLLDDLLDLSKIEAGRLSLETSSFDAALSATTAAEVSAARAAAKGLSLAVCVPAGLDCRMASDPARLRQVLLNLVGNAVKFTERGGVALSVDADELPAGDDGAPVPALRFEVRDSGIGVAPDAQRKLFAEFTQVHDVGARGPGGTGLGLAISKRLVELMGGSIGVESALGKGSRFWFVLPTGRAPCDSAPQAATLTKALAGCRTVVIDPAAVTRQAVARQLSSFGADVVPCADIEEAFIALGDQAGRLSALLAGVGVPAAGAPPKGAAVVVLIWDGRARCVVLRPMGALIQPLHPHTAALEWPAPAAALLDALKAETAPRPQAFFPSIAASSPPGFAAPAATPMLGRILLAEDGETNRMVATAFLERAGYEVIHAANGREALEAMEGMTFDAVLMDIAMPVMDGLEATRRIRALPPPAGLTPIIALTADAAEEDRRRCLDAGMNDHLPKPLERGQLLAAAARWTAPQPAAAPLAEKPGPSASDDGLLSWGGGKKPGRGEALAFAAPVADPAPAAPAADPFDDGVLNVEALQQLERDLDREMLTSLIGQFLEEAAGRVARLNGGAGDVAMLRREAHTLKSTAGTFGACGLSAAARVLETACISAQGAGAASLDDNFVTLAAALPSLLADAAAAYRRAGWLG